MDKCRSILIVDDDEETLVVIAALLRRSGYGVDTARTVEEAERLLGTTCYRAVITDLHLSGMLGEEGLEILSFVRERHPEIAVILLTGYGSPEVVSKAYQRGAAFYFEKPVHPHRLIDSIQELFALARQDVAS